MFINLESRDLFSKTESFWNYNNKQCILNAFENNVLKIQILFGLKNC